MFLCGGAGTPTHPPTSEAPQTNGSVFPAITGGAGSQPLATAQGSKAIESLTLFDFSFLDLSFYKQLFMVFAFQRGTRVWMGTVTKSHL